MIPLLENNRSIYQGEGNRVSIVKGLHINIHNVMTGVVPLLENNRSIG